MKPLYRRMLCAQFVLSIGSSEQDFKISTMFLCNFLIGEGWRHLFEQTWVPFTRGCFVQSLVKIDTSDLEIKDFKFCQCIFFLLLFFPLGKGSGFLFEWIWIPYLNEFEFLSRWCITSMYFCYSFIIPLGKWFRRFFLTNFTLPTDVLCKVWLK